MTQTSEIEETPGHLLLCCIMHWLLSLHIATQSNYIIQKFVL